MATFSARLPSPQPASPWGTYLSPAAPPAPFDADAMRHQAFAPVPRPRHSADQRWDERDRMRALWVLGETGSPATAARETGIPQSTIVTWAAEAEADPTGDVATSIESLRLAVRAETAHHFARLSALAVREAEDRLLNGDEHVTAKGTIIRKKVGFKDLMWGASIATDKHALLTGLVDGRKVESSLRSLAASLVSEFRQAMAPTAQPSDAPTLPPDPLAGALG